MLDTKRVLLVGGTAGPEIQEVEWDIFNQSLFKTEVLQLLKTDFQTATVHTLWSGRLGNTHGLLELVEHQGVRGCVVASIFTEAGPELWDYTVYQDVDAFMELATVLRAVELLEEREEIASRLSCIRVEVAGLPLLDACFPASVRAVCPDAPFCLEARRKCLED